MISNNNYVNIQGFMVTDLKLKGNELIIYAIIYGFCQTRGQVFRGSIGYLQEWTNSSRPGVIKSLNKLVEKGIIIKEERNPINYYYPAQKSVTGGNILAEFEADGQEDLSVENRKPDETAKKVKEVVTYLNEVCHSEFKATTNSTAKIIKARLNEGFTVDDLKLVIDCKYQDWGISPKRFSNGQYSNEYLRPSTLFSGKFDNYLHEARARLIQPTIGCSVSQEISDDIVDDEIF